MDRKIPRVVLAGATGNVGRSALKHLLECKFPVTILTRKGSAVAKGEVKPPTSGDVTVRAVDPESLEELTEAVRGHEAVVDATRASEEAMTRLIDAAAAAGVYRFIPSDFGQDPLNEKIQQLPVVAPKAARERHLWDRCRETGMTWTTVANGPFLDWSLRSGFMRIDIFNRKAALMDGGGNVTPWTTLDDVGKAIAEILMRPHETENRPVYIHSVSKSCQQMLKLCQDAFGTTSEDWTVENVDGKAQFDQAVQKMQSGQVDMSVFQTMILYMNSQPDMVYPWPKSDNELLGIKEMSDADIMELIRECFKKGPLSN